MYNAQDVIVSSDRHDRANGFFPSNESITESSPYMIPRCRPDKARMCDAPLLLNADFTSGLIPDRSPVIRAEIMLFV